MAVSTATTRAALLRHEADIYDTHRRLRAATRLAEDGDTDLAYMSLKDSKRRHMAGMLRQMRMQRAVAEPPKSDSRFCGVDRSKPEGTMPLGKAVKTALDETRLLILGAQVLLRFQLQAMFREGFGQLLPAAQYVCEAALLLMAGTVCLLIAPSMQHRLVEGGQDSPRLLRVARRYAVAALVPFTLALALDFHVIFAKQLDTRAGIFAAGVFTAVCAGCGFFFRPFLRAASSRARSRQWTTKPYRLRK